MAYSYQGTLSVSEDDSVGLFGELNYGVQSLSPVSTSDYNTLTNKPRINNVELVGNITTERLGIRNGEDGFSPVITERETELGYNITITDVEGSNTITLKNGTNGLNGTNGQDGKSAYEIAVEQGFVGTETEWLESLKGQDGRDGIVMDAPSDGKLYGRMNANWVEATVTVDNILSATSENPVQNKVITEELNKKATQTTVDESLALKANSADVTASLAEKSDIGHTHDDRYYTETEVDALIEPLDKAKHTHENKENVLDKLTTNTTGDTLLFNGQKIKGYVEIDDTTTTAEDKVWSAKKINDTIDEVKQSVTEVDNKFSNYDTSTEVDNKITNALADYSTTTEIDTKLTDYAKTADVDTKLADYYKKTETYSNTEIDNKFTDFETNLTDDIKVWVNSEESLAIKTALYNNNTLMFYKKPNATVNDTADFSINLPEEQFLDQAKTTFINNFIWSEELYPNSTNPNLDNEPVLILAVKGDTDVVYSFVSMNELVKIYKASTTVSTVTLTIDDAANTISAEVNISADEGNLLKIGTDGGLYAKATVDNALSDTSENPVQNKVINVALNSKANASDLSDHTNNADIHVTAEEKTSWNNKAELTDIPSSLPANGGNADTVDDKHASDFMQNLGRLSTGSLLDYVLTMTNSGYLFVGNGVTDIPVSGQFFFVDVRRDTGGSYAITATRFNAGGVYTNRYNVGTAKWYGWSNVADGGNAASVGTYTEAKIAALEARIAALEGK